MTIAYTQRLLLRRLCAADGESLDAVFGDSEVMRFSDGIKSPAQVRRWIDEWIDELYDRWGFGMWAVVRRCDDRGDERMIGYCGLSRFPNRILPSETEIGFRVARPFWGQGFATEAVVAARDYAFGTLEIPKLVALVDPGNMASIRVVEKAGFGYERDAMLDGYDHPDRVYSMPRPGDA